VNICYFVNTYPLGSSTFIRREILAVERAGANVSRIALRVGDPLVEPADIEERKKTEYVLAQPIWLLLESALKTTLRAPLRTLRALGLAARIAQRSREGYFRHAAYFVEACHLARRCRDLGIDHVHTHFGTNSAAIAMLANAMGGAPYSFTVHGPEEFDMPLSLSLGDKIARAAFVVGVSSFGRSQLYRWTDAANWPRVKIVNCGFDKALFAQVAPLPGQRRLVTIGRLVEQKGQLLLIEAMANAVRICPSLHLTVIGDGVLRGEIETAIRRYGLEQNVTMLGWLDEQAVRRELAAADALVLPSFAEGLPVVLMEAMASARPVITTTIAGIPELVTDKVHGWLVPAGDVGALSDAIVRFAATRLDKLTAMGEACRERALERHDIDGSAAQLIELFAAAMGTEAVAARNPDKGSLLSLPATRPFGEAGPVPNQLDAADNPRRAQSNDLLNMNRGAR
jgi:glycosyltransferase involved in cell wall biosynthesis